MRIYKIAAEKMVPLQTIDPNNPDPGNVQLNKLNQQKSMERIRQLEEIIVQFGTPLTALNEIEGSDLGLSGTIQGAIRGCEDYQIASNNLKTIMSQNDFQNKNVLKNRQTTLQQDIAKPTQPTEAQQATNNGIHPSK